MMSVSWVIPHNHAAK